MPDYLHDVFVSYQSRDRRWVEKFVVELESQVSQRAGRHVPIWWDQQNIGPGDDWNQKMLQDARQARVFIPVISPSWQYSQPCEQELAAFLERGTRSELL